VVYWTVGGLLLRVVEVGEDGQDGVVPVSDAVILSLREIAVMCFSIAPCESIRVWRSLDLNSLSQLSEHFLLAGCEGGQ
jgi:hypothetical protein